MVLIDSSRLSTLNKVSALDVNVIVSIKLSLGVGNDEYTLCKFGGGIMSVFKVLEGGLQNPLAPPPPPPPHPGHR